MRLPRTVHGVALARRLADPKRTVPRQFVADRELAPAKDKSREPIPVGAEKAED